MPDREHVVRPDEHARERDADRRERDRLVAEDRLPREDRDDLREHPHRRQHHDVDLGVAEEPEHVLPEERPVVAGEEGRPGLAVEEEERDRRRDRRQDEHEQHRVGLDRPDEERDAHPGHPRRAHVVDRDDEVDRPGERGERRQVEAEDPEVLARPRAELLGRERRVGGPAGARGAPVGEEAREDDEPAEEEEPVREGVQARERHVPRADHERDEVVAEAREDRDDEEEDHHRPVHGEQLVVGVLRDEVVVRLGELGAHEQRHHAGGEEEDERRDDVEDPDPLVVERRQPARDAAVAPGRGRGLRADGHQPWPSCRGGAGGASRSFDRM